MKMIAPNIARPMKKPSAVATLKTAERNRRSGMIGSAARRSCQTNATSSTTRRDGEPEDLRRAPRVLVPPQVVTRISALTPAVSSAAPR